MSVTATSIPIGWDTTAAAGQYGNLTAPQKWDLHSHVGMYQKDLLSVLEGPGQDSFVVTRQDLKAGDGTILKLRTTSGFYMEGVRGTATFTANELFEQRKYAEFGLLVGAHRHASSSNEALEADYALDLEIEDGTAAEEGRWMGRRFFENGAMWIRERIPGSSRMWAGGKTLETLLSTDTLDRNQIIIANDAMKMLGGGRANVMPTDSNQIEMRTVCLAPSVALTRLKLDPAYQQIVRDGGTRGSENYIFRQKVMDMDDTVFWEHDSFMHDGDGPKGSVLQPMGTLNTEILAGTAVFDILFGSNSDNVYYSKHFPGYNYPFQQSDTLASPASAVNQYLPTYIHGSAGTTENIATGGEHYVMIMNPLTPGFLSDGTTPYTPGAINFYAYTTGNNGKKITITARLGSAAGGNSGAYRGRVTTLPSGAAGDNTATALGYAASGVVTWGSGTYGGRTLTATHPAGSLIFPCNAKGVVFGYSVVMGGGALYRAYGIHKLKRGFEKVEDGFVSKAFSRGYIGHRPRYDREGRTPALMLVGCAIQQPSLPFPIVTS